MRPLRTLGQNGCPNCLVFAECGGHPLPLIHRIGCANSAASVLGNTDDMHPNFEERFWELWKDVDGTQNTDESDLIVLVHTHTRVRGGDARKDRMSVSEVAI